MHRKFVCKLFTQPFHWTFGFQPISDGQIKRMHQMNVYWLLQHVTIKRKQQATRLHITAAKSGTSKHSKQHAPVAATTSQLTTV
jgi:hypothetical protein